MFIVTSLIAGEQLKDWASYLKEFRHSRKRRDSILDNADSEDIISETCSAGQGLSSDGNNCGKSSLNEL